MADHTEVKLDPNGNAHLETATLEGKNKVLGVWLFIAAETVLFACLFGTYLALRNQTMGGPTTQDLYDLNLIAVTTAILLTSSLTSVLAVNQMNRLNKKGTIFWFTVTVLLGLAFLALEIYEFVHYVSLGHTFTSSAFGSAFYTLVGTHGAHVTFGIVWISTLIYQTYKQGLTTEMGPKLFVASLYWHFIDVVWVFIFTLVYLLGKVG